MGGTLRFSGNHGEATAPSLQGDQLLSGGCRGPSFEMHPELCKVVPSTTQMAAVGLYTCVCAYMCMCTERSVLKRQMQSLARTRQYGGGPRLIFEMFPEIDSSVSGTRAP